MPAPSRRRLNRTGFSTSGKNVPGLDAEPARVFFLSPPRPPKDGAEKISGFTTYEKPYLGRAVDGVDAGVALYLPFPYSSSMAESMPPAPAAECDP